MERYSCIEEAEHKRATLYFRLTICAPPEPNASVLPPKKGGNKKAAPLPGTVSTARRRKGGFRTAAMGS